jgi:hypothetical protein
MGDIDYCDIPPEHDWSNPLLGEFCEQTSQDAIDGWLTQQEKEWFPEDTSAKLPASTAENIEERFLRLANEWSRETGHISSASDLINDTRYQQIISLGWPVVPYLLNDLERNRRFWFPALAAITGLRPFDPGDASNYRRMADAWLHWGRRKGLI